MSKKKEAFLRTLNQGPFWGGLTLTSGASLCQTYFYGDIPKMLEDLYGFKQELVHREDTDECSGDLHTVWKFTIPAHKDYSGYYFSDIQGVPEEVFYLRFEGFYRSHEGSEYTSFREVQPETKTVTVYE